MPTVRFHSTFLHSSTLHAEVSRLRSAPDRDQIVDLMIDFAEAESAVADAFLVEQDDERNELGPWRDGLDRLTTAFCASLAGDSGRLRRARPVDPARSAAAAAGRRGRDRAGQGWEGFSCYALYPEQYVDAAQQVAGMDDSSAFVCIGLRSIGAVLA